MIHGLHYHLAEPLARAHDVGGVDGLIGAYEQHALCAEFIRCEGNVERSEDVVFDCLIGAVLHQRHMLMRCRVENELGMIGFEDRIDPCRIAHGTDERFKMQLGIFCHELNLDSIGIVLIYIKDDERFRFVSRYLTAKLAADGTASAGDENDAAHDVFLDAGKVNMHRVTAEQVFNLDITDLLNAYIPVCELINTGKNLYATWGLLTDLNDLLPCGMRYGGYCDNDLLDLIFLCGFDNIISGTNDADAGKIAAAFLGIVINNADDLILGICAPLKITKRYGGSAACTDKHGPLLVCASALFALTAEKTI